MSLQELENKLNALRQKWMGHVPKSDADPTWWNFKCDSVIATGIKRQIEEIKSEPPAHSEGV